MKKILTIALLCFNFQSSYNDFSEEELYRMYDKGTIDYAPEHSVFLMSKDNLHSFYDNLDIHQMITKNNDNSISIDGFIFLNNFSYEIDLGGIIFSILELCLSHSKLSSTKHKIDSWEKNLIKNFNNEEIFSDENYQSFVKLFIEVFCKPKIETLSEFDYVNFDLKFIYVDPSNECKKIFSGLKQLIALASSNITTIKELFIEKSFIRGKYKIKSMQMGTSFSITPYEKEKLQIKEEINSDPLMKPISDKIQLSPIEEVTSSDEHDKMDKVEKDRYKRKLSPLKYISSSYSSKSIEERGVLILNEISSNMDLSSKSTVISKQSSLNDSNDLQIIGSNGCSEVATPSGVDYDGPVMF